MSNLKGRCLSGSKQNYRPFVFTRLKPVLHSHCSDTIT